jgi:hypothetical protein
MGEAPTAGSERAELSRGGAGPSLPRPQAWPWRLGAFGISVGLHLVAVLFLAAPVPLAGRQAEPAAVPVEIVNRAPEPPRPEAAEPPQAKAPPASAVAPPPAAREKPPLTDPDPGLPPTSTPPASPKPPAPPLAAAPETESAPGGRKVDAEDEAPPKPQAGKIHGYWVLDPLTANLRHRCGLARISGVIQLKEAVAEGHYRGTLRTRIGWSDCAPEGVLYQVELRISGTEVVLYGQGFADRGVIKDGVMILEDSYGRSIWRKR